MRKAKNIEKTASWDIPEVEATFSLHRDAAAACFYALHYEPAQEWSLLVPLLQECFPGVDIPWVQTMLNLKGEFEGISEGMVDEILEIPRKEERYEILPHREAVLRVLTLDFLAKLKSAQAVLSEDAVTRVLRYHDDSLRGSTTNATQIVSGQRTRIRRYVRTFALLGAYMKEFYPHESLDRLFQRLPEVLKPLPNEEMYSDNFECPELWSNPEQLNARGRFIVENAHALVEQIVLRITSIDEVLQKASKRWKLSRIAHIELALLRIATYELMYERLAPARIIINESIELAKAFAAEQSMGFINGILQQVCTDCDIATH